MTDAKPKHLMIDHVWLGVGGYGEPMDKCDGKKRAGRMGMGIVDVLHSVQT